MKDRYESFSPLLLSPSLAAEASIEAGVVNCRNLELICVTTKVTFASDSDDDLTVQLFYSPDGKSYDTEVFDSMTLTDVASTAVQKSELFEVPDTGWMKIVLSNASEAKAITDLKCWASVVYKFKEDEQTQAST
jgi:hypothetical protein